MLTAEGRVKILDFGLARAIASAAPAADATRTMALTQPGTILGTVSYMSPEQASGAADVDGRSDQFSLGLIVHEMITGKKAFERPTAAEVMTAIIREDPPPLPASLPGPFRWAIERCLAKEPAQRYDTTRDLFVELRQLRDHASEISATQSPAPVKPKRGSRVALGALLAGLAAGFLLALLWLEAPLAQARYLPFATEPGIQTMPAWSPTGDRIAYSAEVNGIFQVFVRKIGSSTPSQITRQDASCFMPFWSPDAARIYYMVDRQGLYRSLWSAGVAGGDAEKALDGVAHAALSRDGKTLVVAVHQPDSTYALMLSSPPGSLPKPFSQGVISGLRAAFDWQLTFEFSKDGRDLGLITNARGKTEFLKIPMDGSAVQELPQVEMGDFNNSFSWLPDGNIVWSTNSTGDGHLFYRDLRSGKDRQITSGASRERYHALSPDNRTLAFQAGQIGYDLVEVPLDGSSPVSVMATERDEVAPSWAPDGAHFAYATDRSGVYEIWLRSRQDGSERMIVSAHDFPDDTAGIAFLDCAISPDGSRVAYRRYLGSTVEIWISSLAGGTPVRLYNDPLKVFQRGASWSPDGNWIAYYSTYNGKPAVLKIRVGANHEPELVAYASDLNPVRWSPRGDWIAWNDGHKLAVASADGKQKRIVSQKQWLTYGWSQDGNSLYGIGVTENRRLVLGRVEIASEREQVAADLGPLPAAMDLADFQGDFPYRGFSMRPDGKSFLTSVLAIQGDIWLLENFDRRIGWLDRLLRR